MTTAWQLATDGPAAYERNLVPKFVAPCAELLLDLARVVGVERLLDVGCGTGTVARKAAARGAEAAGVEPNDGMPGTSPRISRAASPRLRADPADRRDAARRLHGDEPVGDGCKW